MLSESLTITIPLVTLSEGNRTGLTRGAAIAKSKRIKQQRRIVTEYLTYDARCGPLDGPLTVTLTRISPRALDPGDNLPSALKACRDAVAAFLGIDDRHPRVQWDYAQRRGAVREQAIAITFTRRTP
jgi:hypothetical protein